jgi:hypothetical protein
MNKFLRSRRGEGYIALTMVMLPLIAVILSLSIDGLGLAVTYRRAVGLATVGVQTGTAAISFSGGPTSLSSLACAAAVRAVCENARDGCSTGAVQADCAVEGGHLRVTVSLRPLSMFGGPLSLNADRVVATARGEPVHGIDYGE